VHPSLEALTHCAGERRGAQHPDEAFFTALLGVLACTRGSLLAGAGRPFLVPHER